MASYRNEKKEIELALLAMKGLLTEATPEEQQAMAECRQIITEMLEKYNDIAVVALQMAWLEREIKEG